MSKKVIRFILMIILGASITSYVIFSKPISSVTLDDITYINKFASTYEVTDENHSLYLYTNRKNDPYVYVMERSFGEVQGSTEYDKHPIVRFMENDTSTESIDVVNYIGESYPEYKNYQVIAEIQFSEGVYRFQQLADNPGQFLLSESLPVETLEDYSEYTIVSLGAGVTSLLLLSVTFVDFGSGYDQDKYQQGYKKPQRGKKERY